MRFLQPDQYSRSVDQAGALSLRGPKKDLQASAKREFDGMGWDGWMDGGWDGWDGWGIKNVLEFSLYFVGK